MDHFRQERELPRQALLARDDVVVTWLDAERKLMWTEFVPRRRLYCETVRAESAGDDGRADGLRKVLAAQRRAELAACASKSANQA
tara:strand:+ start:83 stop:340 length:258 start_codon:yes stop_codon:yes gene_type:complete